ncbi:MAG: hypothetical protein A2534_01115 [Candidatus Magasanikbacteria bacterium RIFOXYD2_FULL_39_9]|uniref:Uncharacterized protein n=1 Tax=Candidatus Magasanikbacteria bacterium RIFOXYD1_FULL_40_23 TaxID=1798705 RepID=A0A1F6PAU2_9BACT|nr:MAG: hypothetical protein A2534_01115 [Candidatus Magasanikbacteria bacterium RIFOXYD2_FULL_39_9]OGH93276.1 MAG: hypothetical protein A2563_01575 [Candidatus Magasanikbacteria bacterium RIFOXYD1_FULL_40_23]
MNERVFVKPIGHTGQFILATGELCQDGSLRELPGGFQSPSFRSHNEACMVLFGTMDLRVLALRIQQKNLPLLDRLSILQALMVLRRSVLEELLPQATPVASQIMIAQRMGTCSPDEADQALATLGF